MSEMRIAAPVTSLLAGTIITTGIVGVVELALIAGLSLVALIRARRSADRDYLAATAALAAQFAGLLAVTLITDYQFFFWALVAFVATGPLRLAPLRRAAPAA